MADTERELQRLAGERLIYLNESIRAHMRELIDLELNLRKRELRIEQLESKFPVVTINELLLLPGIGRTHARTVIEFLRDKYINITGAAVE